MGVGGKAAKRALKARRVPVGRECRYFFSSLDLCICSGLALSPSELRRRRKKNGKEVTTMGQLTTCVCGLSELRHSGRVCVNLPFSVHEGRLLNEQTQVQEAGCSQGEDLSGLVLPHQ